MNKQQYIVNKMNYVELGLVFENNMIGGKKKTYAYDLTMGSCEQHNEIKLPEVIEIKKIGDFEIKKTAVIGENDWSEINLSPGMYSAYKVDDNLMVMKSKLGKPDKKEIIKWKWQHSGSGVGVDGGTFGFFDLATIEKLTKDQCDNNLPMFNVKFKNFANGTLIDGKNIPAEQLNGEKRNKFNAFGVMMDTGTGDGGFECYVIDDDKAILIGGYTGGILLDQS